MADEIIKKQITKEGYDELQNELSERKTKKRSEIAARIEDAKAQGDLSENSEYDEARAEQAENETRIEELEAIHEDELLLDPSLELRMTFCEELLTSLRELEELEAIHEELDPSTGLLRQAQHTLRLRGLRYIPFKAQAE